MRFRVEFEAFSGQDAAKYTLAGISPRSRWGPVAIRDAIRSVAGEIGYSSEIRRHGPQIWHANAPVSRRPS
jgi:hypothetical protein